MENIKWIGYKHKIFLSYFGHGDEIEPKNQQNKIETKGEKEEEEADGLLEQEESKRA